MAAAIDQAPEDLLDGALTAVEREYRRTEAEARAFAAFLARVGELAPNKTTASSGISPVQMVTSGTDNLGLVREAYRSTVMAVSHYEEEYSESFAKNIEEELGPDVATLLTSGQVFEPHHKQAVLAGAREAKELRTQLVDALVEERQSVENLSDPVCSAVRDIARMEGLDLTEAAPKQLRAYRKRLHTLEDRCHGLIDIRQSELVGGRRALALPISGPDIATYVYRDMQPNYPVTAILIDIIERVTAVQTAIEAELTRI